MLKKILIQHMGPSLKVILLILMSAWWKVAGGQNQGKTRKIYEVNRPFCWKSGRWVKLKCFWETQNCDTCSVPAERSAWCQGEAERLTEPLSTKSQKESVGRSGWQALRAPQPGEGARRPRQWGEFVAKWLDPAQNVVLLQNVFFSWNLGVRRRQEVV